MLSQWGMLNVNNVNRSLENDRPNNNPALGNHGNLRRIYMGCLLNLTCTCGKSLYSTIRIDCTRPRFGGLAYHDIGPTMMVTVFVYRICELSVISPLCQIQLLTDGYFLRTKGLQGFTTNNHPKLLDNDHNRNSAITTNA